MDDQNITYFFGLYLIFNSRIERKVNKKRTKFLHKCMNGPCDKKRYNSGLKNCHEKEKK